MPEMNLVSQPFLALLPLVFGCDAHRPWEGMASNSDATAGIRQVFTRARAEAPCILIMEDLDSLINDANRSFFLNEVDGLEDNDGLLMVSELLLKRGVSS